MRVNFITSGSRGLMQDCAILHGIFAHIVGGDKLKVSRIPHTYPQCEEAELNVFFEVINPGLFSYASKNIWIPNAEWSYKVWKPYVAMLDEIWCKTHEAVEIFKEWTPKVRYIGWTSIDKSMPERKNYSKAIVPIGRNLWRNPRPIFQAYLRILEENESMFMKLPELHVVYNSALTGNHPYPEKIKSKLVIHSTPLPEKEYNELLHECGLMILMSVAEGFCHAANEGMSAGCNLIVPDIPVFNELISGAQVVDIASTIPHPECLGMLAEVSVESLITQLRVYMGKSLKSKTDTTGAMRQQYESRHYGWIATMEGMKDLIEFPEYSLKTLLPNEEDLPFVSVVTITRDRRAFFALAKHSFLCQAYPAEKIEWVIVDDGKDAIKDLITDLPYVKYRLLDEPMTIGAKRNLAAEIASHDILIHMDDDDVYPNHSILTRVAMMLMSPAKKCVFSTTIPCYALAEHKSFMNVPPITLPWSQRVSEATMSYTREFWRERPFDSISVGEADTFIRGREEACRELSPQDIIVSLCHPKQSTSRKAPEMKEPNGCHYGFSEELYTLIEEIRLSL